MIDYIVANKETFFVLCVMAFLGIMMFFLSGIARRDEAKRRAAASTQKATEMKE